MLRFAACLFLAPAELLGRYGGEMNRVGSRRVHRNFLKHIQHRDDRCWPIADTGSVATNVCLRARIDPYRRRFRRTEFVSTDQGAGLSSRRVARAPRRVLRTAAFDFLDATAGKDGAI